MKLLSMTEAEINSLVEMAETNILSEYKALPEERIRRIDICSQCDFKKTIFNIDYCEDCYCIIKLKANSEHQRCPYGKWDVK